MAMTINEAMIWLKTLRTRQAELIALRDQNSYSERRRFGVGGDKEVERTPTYDVKKLDVLVANISKEIRLVDIAIKKANSATPIDYEANESAMGSLEGA